MFRKKKGILECEQERLLERMASIPDQTSDEYEKCRAQLGKLIDLDNRRNELKLKMSKPIDQNTVLVCATEMIQTGLIMNYERLHVIASKAFGRIVRPKP